MLGDLSVAEEETADHLVGMKVEEVDMTVEEVDMTVEEVDMTVEEDVMVRDTRTVWRTIRQLHFQQLQDHS